MTSLLLLASALALTSAFIQLFGKGRAPGAIPVLALAELLAGLTTPFLALGRSLFPAAEIVLFILVMGLVLYSSTTRVLRSRARRKHRQETEAARLATYVKYFSSAGETGEASSSEGAGQT